MGINIKISYVDLLADHGLHAGTILGDLLQGDLPTALSRLAQLDQVLRELVGAENFSITISATCPQCGAERPIAADGWMPLCVHCGDGPVRAVLPAP